jgi:uncharacterized membrane protein
MNRKYVPSKLKKAFKKYDEEEKEKENFNLKKAEKVIKQIIKKDNPLEKLYNKKDKETKLKPINTKVLLKGFV